MLNRFILLNGKLCKTFSKLLCSKRFNKGINLRQIVRLETFVLFSNYVQQVGLFYDSLFR